MSLPAEVLHGWKNKENRCPSQSRERQVNSPAAADSSSSRSQVALEPGRHRARLAHLSPDRLSLTTAQHVLRLRPCAVIADRGRLRVASGCSRHTELAQFAESMQQAEENECAPCRAGQKCSLHSKHRASSRSVARPARRG